MSHVISSLSASTVPTIVRSPVQPFDSQSDKRTFDTRKEFTDEKKGGTRTAPDKGKENHKKRKKKFIPSRRITASPSALSDSIPTIKMNRLTAPPSITDEILTLITPPSPSTLPQLEQLCSTRMPEILSSSNLPTLINHFISLSPSSLLPISLSPSALPILNRHKSAWLSLPPTSPTFAQITQNMLKIHPSTTLTPSSKYTSHVQFNLSGMFSIYTSSLLTLPPGRLRSLVVDIINDVIAGDYDLCEEVCKVIDNIEERNLLCTATHECVINCKKLEGRLREFLGGEEFDEVLLGLNVINNVVEMVGGCEEEVLEGVKGIVEGAKCGELGKLLKTGEGEFGEKEKEGLMLAGTGSITLGLKIMKDRSEGKEDDEETQEVVRTLVAFANFMEEYVGAVSAGVMTGVVKLIQGLRKEDGNAVKKEEILEQPKEEVVEARELLKNTEKELLEKKVKEELEDFEWIKKEE
ncbi:hypothetical protein TrST_g2441 [Triparma strigata]|uniref:Uncharacterized protein n=1 Tax=Triparma strigata TaxID=1606541 RepID=A0A9W7DUX0_9STRA|nr:hypothetical protein TrST_g2441 [Triparma strigata]